MKPPGALLAIVLLLAGVAACGGGGRVAGTSSHAASRSVKGSGDLPASTDAKAAARPPQNDDYISTYGREAGETDRREIAGLVRRYYAAALAGEGAGACSLLHSTLARAVAEDYGSAPALRGTSCSTVLPKVFRHAPGLSMADLASTRVTGVRLRGDRGFVQLSSRAMPTGEISIEREGGLWKLDALVGRACTNCLAR